MDNEKLFYGTLKQLKLKKLPRLSNKNTQRWKCVNHRKRSNGEIETVFRTTIKCRTTIGKTLREEDLYSVTIEDMNNNN